MMRLALASLLFASAACREKTEEMPSDVREMAPSSVLSPPDEKTHANPRDAAPAPVGPMEAPATESSSK